MRAAESNILRYVGMDNAASERLTVDAMACDLSFIIGLLRVHFGVDAVAGGICQNLKSFVEPRLFTFR